MRVGIIDLGTNSVRFDIHQISYGGVAKRLHREKLLIRLGQGVFLTGKLDRSAVSRALQAFKSFHKTAQELKTAKIIAFGTSALREAMDAQKFLNAVQKKTGIEIRIISGEEEAHYISSGILANETNLKGKFALVDIGGGSTEITLCNGRSAQQMASFPLGTARLQQVFLKSVPPKSPKKGERSAVDALRSHLKSILLTKVLAEDWPKIPLIVGSSGTIRTLGRILKKNGKGTFSVADLGSLNRKMSAMTAQQLLSIPGMDPKRIDMILAGSILLEESALALGARKIRVTDHSLRDGILDEEVRLVRRKPGTTLAFHLEELLDKAKRLGCNETHTKAVVAHATALFDGFKNIHNLSDKWRVYLQAAAILHDIGEAISPTDHATHAYYVVKNAHFACMTEDETDFVAALCKEHSGTKSSVDIPHFDGDSKKRAAFPKLLALLRIADALDRGHKGTVLVRSIKFNRKDALITLSSRQAADLELLRVEQKRSYFERIYKKTLILSVKR